MRDDESVEEVARIIHEVCNPTFPKWSEIAEVSRESVANGLSGWPHVARSREAARAVLAHLRERST